MSDLFKRGGLQQDTGVLAERWNQEGSTLRSATAVYSGADTTLFTVTAGKVFYLRSIHFYRNSLTSSSGSGLKDGSSQKMYLSTGANDLKIQFNSVFDAAIKFETSVVATNPSGGAQWVITVTGWEEDA